MAFRKFASVSVLESWRVPSGATVDGIRKAAHRVAFDYEPRPGYLYVRSRMISSRTNDNHDTFPPAEIEQGYKSFLGKPVFVNHHNANHRRARGVIVAVALHRDKNPDGSPDTWVEGLMEVDAVRFPKLAKAILAGKVNRTSMGVDVEWSTCSACGNKATSPAEYCRHLPALKGKKIRQRNKVTGKVEEKLIHEVCAGLSFFENSLLVEDPADPTAYLLGKPDARGLSKDASLQKTASEPDFHDHIQNACMGCGGPVRYAPGLARRGRYPWKHEAPLADADHPVIPESEDDRYKGDLGPMIFEGTHCAICHEPVKIWLGALDREGGGWSHGPRGGDSLKRDHPAVPADPQAVYDAIPGLRAHYDQAKAAMDNHLNQQFEQLSREKGETFTPRPRGDEDQMPPDPFLASRKTAGLHGDEWCPECGAQGQHLLQLPAEAGDKLPERPAGKVAGCKKCGSVFDTADHTNSVRGEGAPDREPEQFSRNFTHCSNCGVPLLDPNEIANSGSPGDWRHRGYPHLCMGCAIAPLQEGGLEGTPGKPHPVWPGNKGGYESRPSIDVFDDPENHEPQTYRAWGQGDAVKQSTSSRKTAKPAAAGGDHPFFHANPVSKHHIIAAYHDTTDDEKASGDRWYADAHHVAKAIAGGDAMKGAGVLSAYSVRTAWPKNMFNASKAFRGDPPGPGSGAMAVHQKPAMQILAGKHWKEALNGPKTRAFAHLIEHGGDTPEDEKNGTHKVVIDRHALSVALGRRSNDDDDAPLGQHQHYEHVAQLYRDAAHDISKALGRKVSPHQVQAATWLRQIRKNTEEDEAGLGRGGKGLGKGRVTRERNDRDRWREHHPHAHPGGIGEENMHYHGARDLGWPESGERCVNCQRVLDHPADPMSMHHPNLPSMCIGCTSRTAQYPDAANGPSAHDPELAAGSMIFPFSQHLHLQHSTSSRKVAYGETRVPPKVDTLRMEECPVCGEHDVWSGDRCPVCGFIVPPSLFRDPDTGKAQQVRDELDDQGEVELGADGTAQTAPGTGPDGQIGSGEDADDQLVHPDQIAPDGTPGVQGGGGPVPDADTDGSEQEPEEGEEGQLPGAEEIAEGEQLEDQGGEEQVQGQQDEALGEQLMQEGEEDEEQETEGATPDLECPGCGAHYSTDVAAQPGTPCPACGMGSLQPVGGAPEGAEGLPPEDEEEAEEEEAEAEDEGEEPGEDEPREKDEGKKMPASKTAATLAQVQARRIAELTAENAVLGAQLRFLASAAGVDRQLAQIRQAVLRKHADMMNPAQPVPDNPQEAAPESTEQALMPESMDDPSRPGTTPGANAHVPAAMTTTSITPGVEMQTPPATNLIDVNAPIQGTNPAQDGGVPLSQRRIETDVRIDPDPLKASGPGIGGQGNNGSAFPWLLDGGAPQQGGQQKAASRQPGDDGAARTFASIRLAKLRVQAGHAQGDELAVAERIEKDASLPTQMIEHEISVLSRFAQGQQQRPMQRAAARQAPSLASVGASMAAYAPASYGDDDASDIFF